MAQALVGRPLDEVLGDAERGELCLAVGSPVPLARLREQFENLGAQLLERAHDGIALDSDTCREVIRTLNLPEIVLDIYDGLPVPDEVRLYCGHPVVPFEYPWFPGGHPITPLWEGLAELWAFHHIPDGGRFINFDGAGGPQFLDFGASFEPVVADLLYRMARFGEVSEERLRAIAPFFGFNRVEDVLVGCVATSGFSWEELRGEKYASWHRQFLRSFV